MDLSVFGLFKRGSEKRLPRALNVLWKTVDEQWRTVLKRNLLSRKLRECDRDASLNYRLEGRLELSTFCSVSEYLSNLAKMVIVAWRLLLAYIYTTATFGYQGFSE
ncbi:hypothetical protein TNCV_3469101 [Trichonephila clavipes]|nr:hypothetical protein TNCV_3469101 [Trichonephila clavipes]